MCRSAESVSSTLQARKIEVTGPFRPSGIGWEVAPVIVPAVLSWAALFGTSHLGHSAAFCCVADSLPHEEMTRVPWLIGALDGAPLVLSQWILMSGAMMLPLLVPAASYVRIRSFECRRVRAQVMLVVSFWATWSVLGLFILPVQALQGELRAPAFVLPVLAAVIAFAWQISNARCRALKRCHAAATLRPFGVGADWDCARYGVAQAIACLRTCFPAMCAMMLVPGAHGLAVPMTWLLVQERLRRRWSPVWLAGLIVANAGYAVAL